MKSTKKETHLTTDIWPIKEVQQLKAMVPKIKISSVEMKMVTLKTIKTSWNSEIRSMSKSKVTLTCSTKSMINLKILSSLNKFFKSMRWTWKKSKLKSKIEPEEPEVQTPIHLLPLQPTPLRMLHLSLNPQPRINYHPQLKEEWVMLMSNAIPIDTEMSKEIQESIMLTSDREKEDSKTVP